MENKTTKAIREKICKSNGHEWVGEGNCEICKVDKCASSFCNAEEQISGYCLRCDDLRYDAWLEARDYEEETRGEMEDDD